MTDPATADDAAVRRRNVLLAGHRGAVELIVAAQRDDHPSVREAALGALDRIGELSAADVERAGTDTDPAVRRRAAELAASHPSLPVDDVVHELLADTDATVVEIAAWASGERAPHARVLGRLIAETTQHEDALVREAAVAALGAIGEPDGLPTILAATKDRATVRRRAIIALAAFEGPEVDDALEIALGDRDWQVRQAAEDLLDAERAAHTSATPDDPTDHHY